MLNKNLQKQFEKDFLEDDLGNNFIAIVKGQRINLDVYELLEWISGQLEPQVAWLTCGLKLPMTITLKKDELDRGYYDGRTNHSGRADFLYNYCKKKKIPLDEPKNQEGRYDRYIIKLETPEQALNLLLWDKFEALSKLSG